MSFLTGSSSKLKKFETLNKQQKATLHDLLSQLDFGSSMTEMSPMFQQGQSYLSSLLSQDPEMMKRFEAPYMRQFNEEIVPGLAERFSSLGARNSSGFNQAMGQQAGSLAERLASMRANLGMNASQIGFGYSQLPFSQNMQMGQLGLGTSPWGYQALPGQEGALHGLMGGLGQAAGLLPFIL